MIGSIYKNNQAADCTENKKGASKKVLKLGKKNSCDLGRDWDVVNSLRYPLLQECCSTFQLVISTSVFNVL